jgi:hypothetical protein
MDTVQASLIEKLMLTEYGGGVYTGFIYTG